jgi:hypothetical protein
MDFVARNNHVLQSGTPKRDVVFWSKKTRETSAGLVPIYEHLDLVEAGERVPVPAADSFQRAELGMCTSNLTWMLRYKANTGRIRL